MRKGLALWISRTSATSSRVRAISGLSKAIVSSQQEANGNAFQEKGTPGAAGTPGTADLVSVVPAVPGVPAVPFLLPIPPILHRRPPQLVVLHRRLVGEAGEQRGHPAGGALPAGAGLLTILRVRPGEQAGGQLQEPGDEIGGHRVGDGRGLGLRRQGERGLAVAAGLQDAAGGAPAGHRGQGGGGGYREPPEFLVSPSLLP